MNNSSFARMGASVIIVAAFLAAAAGGALGQTALTQGTPVNVPPTTPSFNYSVTLQQSQWNVIALTTGANDDWNIYHGTASSTMGQGWCDYVLADGHQGVVSGNTGTVNFISGTAGCDVVHAASAGTITATQTATGTGSYSFLATDVLVVWEIDVQTAGNYNITVNGNSSMFYDWFVPQTSSAWTDASFCSIFQSVGTPMNNQNLALGYHLLLVYVNNGIGTASNLSVSIQPAVPIMNATSVATIAAPPVSVLQGATFQATRTITNNGGATGQANYSLYLSTDTTIDTSDIQVYSGLSGAITPGGADNQTVTCTVPGATAAGNYYLGLYIAPGGTGFTANTTNADVTVTVPTPPAAFALTAPANASTGVALTPTFTWNAATGADSYTLQVSTASDFSSFLINQANIVNTTLTPAITLSYLTTYYWRVLAVNAHGNTTSTGAPWSFTTIPAGPPPSAFDLIAPANAATNFTQYPAYSWNPSSGAATYTLQVSTASDFSSFIENVSGLTSPSHAPGTMLAASTVHYWRVIAYNSNGPTTSNGAPWSFTTAPPTAPPSAFSLTAPANSATGVVVNPTYQWNAATGATEYALQVSTATDFNFKLVDQQGLTALSFTPSGNLGSNTTYYWRVIASNTGGYTTSTGAPWSFTTGSFTPQATSITVNSTPPIRIPVGGTFQVTRVISNAGDVPGAVAYEVRISTDSTITSADTLVFGGVTGSIAVSGSDSNTVTCTIGLTTPIDTDWYVGLYINSSNTAVATAQIRTLPNYARFAASACTISGGSFETGSQANVGFSVGNDGGAAGATGYTVYLSQDATIDATDRQLATGTTSSLAADGGSETPSVQVTIPADVAAGTWYVGVFLNASQTTTQTAASSSFQVTKPASGGAGGSCAQGEPGSGAPMALLPLLALAAFLALRRVGSLRLEA